MLTDVELIELHKNKEYKKANGLIRNFKYTIRIVKFDQFSEMITMKFENGEHLVVKGDIVKIFWFICKYYFITRELIDYRIKIIEGILGETIKYNEETLITESMGIEYVWMEPQPGKLEVMKKICIAYLNNAENRKIFFDACKRTKTGEEKEEEMQSVIVKIRQLFNQEIMRVKQQQLRKYHTELYNEEEWNERVAKFAENLFRGKLTDGVEKGELKDGN